MLRRVTLLLFVALLTCSAAPVDHLIPWLLDEGAQLLEIPFSEVIVDVTGKKVLPFDAKNEIDQRVRKAIAATCDETMKRLNACIGQKQSSRAAQIQTILPANHAN
jgi:hypothetical protein